MCRNGYEAWFVYDTGWTTLIFSDFDWTLYAVILLISVGSFASEYDSKSSTGGFVQILRTTKYGHHKTYISKILAGAILSVILTIVWNLIDFLWLYISYDLPLWNAPIHSIEALGGLKQDMSIYQYLMCFYGIRIFATCYCNLCLIFNYFDFTKLMQASSLMLQGSHGKWFTLAAIIIDIILLIHSERTWEK